MTNEAGIVWETLKKIEIPVKIEDREYVLVEASADDAKIWRANNFQSIETKEQGRGKLLERKSNFNAGIANSQILLVSLCLKKIEGNTRVNVRQEIIASWPNKLVEMLFQKSQEISGLRDEDQDEETVKNEQQTSTSSSKSQND